MRRLLHVDPLALGAAAVAAGLLALAGCSGSGPDQPPASPSGPTVSAPSGSATTPTATATPAPPTALVRATAALGRLTLVEQVGQLFMVGIPAGGRSVSAVRVGSQQVIGNVMLTGRTSDPATEVSALTRRVRAAATTGDGAVRPFIATDQEGGAVQVLQGAGFADLPSALVQGHWAVETLRRRAVGWGRELHAAGVNLDLAPVADTVPGAAAAAVNPPIGAYDREFGYTPDVVESHVLAFVGGLGAARVATAVKHFPGLGYVRANTDTSALVVDRFTTTRSASLEPFRAAVQAGVPLVMVSTATYQRIDPDQPAAFSRTVITGLLRGQLGFSGVVISDDLGAARQVQSWSPAQRAVRFVAAGGDLVLTVTPSTVDDMYDAVLARAKASATFRAQVHAAALRVLTAKASYGLLLE